VRIATPEERDRLSGFTSELFLRLSRMQANGATTGNLIAHLRQSGVPMPVASVALRKIDAVATLVEARDMVNQSTAYAKWPEYDESYPEIYKIQAADAA
jgi:hypothetical protein